MISWLVRPLMRIRCGARRSDRKLRVELQDEFLVAVLWASA
jgi:hypothetical protein